jgi:hypothetical protein
MYKSEMYVRSMYQILRENEECKCIKVGDILWSQCTSFCGTMKSSMYESERYIKGQCPRQASNIGEQESSKWGRTMRVCHCMEVSRTLELNVQGKSRTS